jgi:hypothetical protein
VIITLILCFRIDYLLSHELDGGSDGPVVGEVRHHADGMLHVQTLDVTARKVVP